MASSPNSLLSPLPPGAAAALREALTSARSGDLQEARRIAEAAVGAADHPALRAFLGAACGRMRDWPAAARHLRIARAANPDDMTIAANLLDALIATEAFEEAVASADEATAARDPNGRLWRGRGYALQRLQRYDASAVAYRAVVAATPDDAEAWNNLGNALAASGESDAALTALRRAAQLAPDSGPIQLNLATTLRTADRWDEAESILRARLDRVPDDANAVADLTALLHHRYRDDDALAVLEAAVAARPMDAALHIRLAEAQATRWDFATAETLLRKALTLDPVNPQAFVQLALALEHGNREEELATLVHDAGAAAIDEGALHFLRALVCRRDGRFAEGLAHIMATPATIEPVRRLQLEGQFRDRLDDPAGAFAAFTAMNALLAQDPSDPPARAARFGQALAARRAAVTPAWAAAWKNGAAEASASPTFLVGFPRSGTTLLDTILLGHRDVQLLEERPPLQRVEDAAGDYARLPDLDDREIGDLRALYWRGVDQYCDRRPAAMLVDKQPLYMNKLPLIHRLFPKAKIILALRHPCDVVLSCFMTSFRLNDAMSTFLDLRKTVDLYAESFSFLEQSRTLLPLDIREVRYEALIDDPANVMLPLFDWLGLAWDDGVLDHRRTAKRRGVISTASYAQVTEPLYRRAAGRWGRYRLQLDPILPVLRPWIERYGYTLDD